MICRLEGGDARFISRNGQDWTDKFRHLADAATGLPCEQALLDGEVVAIESNGATSFQALQNAFSEGRSRDLVYYVFDVVHLDGYDLTKVGLQQRKEVLADLLGNRSSGPIRYVEHIEGNGPEFYDEVCRVGLEGIICKQRDRPYRPGRTLEWLKVKCVAREEFVIGGYSQPEGSRIGFGALLLGYHDKQGNLKYAGRVGTGFTEESLRQLHSKLKRLKVERSPFADFGGRTGKARGVTWVKPELVAQVEFSNWTDDQLLRHPSFQGLREDKAAASVVRDRAIDPIGAKNGVPKLMKKSSSGRRSKTAKAAATAKKAHTSKAVATSVASDPQRVKDQLAGVRLTHPEKVLYPEQGITKFDLAAYYVEIADWILPHVVDRPLTLVRCPEGYQKSCFYQKHPGMGASKLLRQIPIREKHKTENYLIADDLPGLISLVQIGVLEIHVWGSRADKVEQPDRLIFDLDPDPAVKWPEVIVGALRVRDFLADLGLVSFVKTTGGKGLHVVAPIQRRLEWDDVKEFCRAVAESIVAEAPDRYLAHMSKAARKGKIFIDYLRNDRGATSIISYSTRARDGAPVSTPLAWEELTPEIKADHFNIQNLPPRLVNLKRDPWAEMASTRQSITAAMRKKLGV